MKPAIFTNVSSYVEGGGGGGGGGGVGGRLRWRGGVWGAGGWSDRDVAGHLIGRRLVC